LSNIPFQIKFIADSFNAARFKLPVRSAIFCLNLSHQLHSENDVHQDSIRLLKCDENCRNYRVNNDVNFHLPVPTVDHGEYLPQSALDGRDKDQ
jgi:hypothetical protein